MAAQLGLPLVSCHHGSAAKLHGSSSHLVPDACTILQAGNRRQKARAAALRKGVVFARVVRLDSSLGLATSDTMKELADESAAPTAVPSHVVLGRSSFPRGFSFGAASSAYQHGSWIHFYPRGMKELLLYTKRRYKNPKIYITENGTAEVVKESEVPIEVALQEPHWNEYLTYHFAEVLEAIREGVRVKGHFAWSLTDNFEWHEGYIERFGLTYIYYDNDFKHYPKDSTIWLSRFTRT